ncbi:MAG: hypothetical protein C0397_17115 [Odoribacter sp.]|nr:hypothetical protein [Odoribacter sp.]
MADILFNKQGVPMMAYGKSYLGKTTGVPSAKPKLTSSPKPAEINLDKTSVGEIKIASWGSSNNWPSNADDIISKVGTLNTGLRFTRNFTLGQGIFPCIVTGYDANGNELLAAPSDPALTTFANSRMTRRYMEVVLRDFLKLGIGYIQFILNDTGDTIVGINPVNAKYCRLSVANLSGIIEKCVVSGKWPDTPGEGEYTVHELLDEYDPLADLQRRRYANKTKGKSFMMLIRDSWSNNEYYSAPLWYASYLAGWVDIAGMIPSFLKKAYTNQITWKWHIQIPYAFWDRQFPANEFETTELRKTAISDYMDSVENNLCGIDNADKPIFTFFEINPMNGKAEEKWEIQPLNNKLNNEQNLITSAAANSEIMFAIMVNPNVMGAGMPGGAYAGNSGGSNIREAYLVNVANAWLDRQTITDPLEITHRFNGGDVNVEWRFRNTILTTLDTGAGTKKVIS